MIKHWKSKQALKENARLRTKKGKMFIRWNHKTGMQRSLRE